MIVASKQYTILIADDHSIVRQGFKYIINDNCENSFILEAKSFKEINEVLSTNIVNFLILDLNFPDGNSISLIPEIKKKYPDVKILVFTAHDEELYAIKCINAGADGYLSKVCSEDEMINAFIAIKNRGKFISPKIRDIILDSYLSKTPKNLLQSLSEKELEIASLFVKGLSNQDIVNQLDIKKSTVSTFKNRIFEKLGVKNISNLIEIFNLYYHDK